MADEELPPPPTTFRSLAGFGADNSTLSDEAQEMRRDRKIRARTGAVGGGGGGNPASSLRFATGRPRDPFWYWRENNLPYDVQKDEELKRVREFCNTPDAPVWMGDYGFKPIGSIQVGDEVMGWEWYQTGQKKKSRLTRTPVLAIQRRIAPMIVKITMESGRVIRCTPDHQWANPWFSPSGMSQAQYQANYRARQKGLAIPYPKGSVPIGAMGKWEDEFRCARVGGQLRHVIDPSPQLSDEKERNIAAWLGGVYDGEGSYDGLGQCAVHNPEVRQRILDSFDLLGIPYWVSTTGVNIRISAPKMVDGVAQRGRGNGYVKRQHLVNFLNWCNPTHSKTKVAQWDSLLLTSNFGTMDTIESIEEEGPGEVISMQTGTGNYTAWGYASKNCRLLYLTHPTIASCIDVFSEYPLSDMHLECKDDALTAFYEELFFEQLNYKDFLADVGHEHWLVGEAFPMASFNEMLGVWDDDQLIEPNDVEVHNSAFFKEPWFEMTLPAPIKEIIEKRDPKWEYEQIMQAYPEMMKYTGFDALMPVSSVLMKQIKFNADSFHPRGLPILLRGFRAVWQEEMLSAAVDAIASRLYTPLIVAKLGASATDLGTNVPWIPNDQDLMKFEDSLDAALAADFRVLIHHFGLQIDTVFGRENVPDLTADFERLEGRMLQVFGLSKTILQGASEGETYAADAMNLNLVGQRMQRYQRKLKKFFKDRALVVAEAQEHYDYEERGGKRYPIMEEVMDFDMETGKPFITKQPKLLVPTLEFKEMSMVDEQAQQQYLMSLKMAGVPIADKTFLQNVPIDYDEEIDRMSDEQTQKAVAAQLARRETYLALKRENLPIPPDLLADFQPEAGTMGPTPSIPAVLPNIDTQSPAEDYTLNPPPGTPTDQITNMPPQVDMNSSEPVGSGPPATLPRNQIMQQFPDRPPESDQMRQFMPKASNVDGEDEEPQPMPFTQPRHLGMRKNRKLDPKVPLDEQMPNRDEYPGS